MRTRLVTRTARTLRTVRWYLRELTGEAQYERYCTRHQNQHPHTPAPTRREFETLQAKHREEHPTSRCC
ncbi:YbdD/YjiX family protein [Streptomyces cinnabarinus]|uniref:YbdD/YjiX family protein n=1 Tax=Streptomyces cinnabarinus TaxID=67287 RepID=A0ABY7KSX0_9ACTN|nr:YbdD/YjiX family protein [Streptomyces cinnabarinus]WAZ26628.1 YbdD/YjiX family protein [Streptomyces cinnabarinus]